MELVLKSDIVKRWLAGDDPVATIRDKAGVVVRSKEGRTTKKIEIDGHSYYAKLHEGVGWREILKNLLQLRLPIIGATNEWLAINTLRSAGLDTLNAVAFGRRGINPAAQKSFIITEELTGTLSLARYAQAWPESPPDFRLRQAIIEKVAQVSRELHGLGINHRDLYICHFLLDVSMGLDTLTPDHIRMFLVDLHRAQIRSKVPYRWLVKDVGSIYFSSLDIGLTRKDVFRFLKVYFEGTSLRDILSNKSKFLKDVEKRSVSLYRRDFGRAPQLPL